VGVKGTPFPKGERRICRREFLKLAGLGGAVLCLPWKLAGNPGAGTAPTWAGAKKKLVFAGTRPGAGLRKYADPLPIIPVLPDTGVAHHYQVDLGQFAAKIHRDLPPTPLWGCGAPGAASSWPGPTLEARVNVPVRVRWQPLSL